MGKSDQKGPRIVYRRSFSQTPGSQEELDRILLQWELALARKAKAILDGRTKETGT